MRFSDTTTGEERIPFGQALADIAEDHYVFQSAAEGGAPLGDGGGPGDVERRMAMLEEGMVAIQASLNAMVGQRGMAVGDPFGGGTQQTTPVAVPLPSPKRKSALKRPKDAARGAEPLASMDPAVVHSARQAGIPEDQLNALARLLGKTNRMGDHPAASKAAPRGMELSESGEEEEEAEAADGGALDGGQGQGEPAQGTPIEKALVQLTKIVGRMSRKPGRDLEALLDGADGGSGEAGLGAPTGKSKAAAYKRLKAALTENPSFIYETIESFIKEDFRQAKTAPGATNLATSWIEHRSKLAHYPSSIRAMRAALSVAAWDQSSLDSGSDHVAGGAAGGCTTICSLPQPKDARTSRTSCKQVDRRAVAGSAAMEVAGPRQLPRSEEEVGPEQRKRRRRQSSCGGPQSGPAEERRKADERRKEGWKRRRSIGGRSRSFMTISAGEGPSVGPAAPGLGASTVHGRRIWELLWSSLCRSRTRLRFTWIAARSNPGQSRAAAGRVWPMPLPYPEVHRSKVGRQGFASSLKLGVNFVVLSLNHLQNKGRHWRSSCPGNGTPLNKEQWDAVRVVEEHVRRWNDEAPVTAEDMGRAASKVESTEEVLGLLEAGLVRRD